MKDQFFDYILINKVLRTLEEDKEQKCTANIPDTWRGKTG